MRERQIVRKDLATKELELYIDITLILLCFSHTHTHTHTHVLEQHSCPRVEMAVMAL